MSMVTLQLGQCGNQIGPDLFGILSSDALHGPRRSYGAASRERFFHSTAHGDLVARAVLIDMEPKVIKQSMAKAAASGTWRYGDASHFSQKQGSGNNWANGYCVHGPRHREVVEELVRREVERCDRLAGLMAMMSVAGGTGSGVGTYITQCLRDTYAKSFILNHLTWPYRTGEVIVQNYNSVLTLAHLYQLSDAILVHENDMVHKICSQLLNIKHISFSDVNRVIAHQMGSVLQPSLSADSHGDYSRNPLGGFEDPALYTSWLSSKEAFNTWKCPVPFNKYEKSATLVSNSQALLRPLDTMVGKAWNMFASRAYIHQYIKFGISEEDFLESFTSLEQVIASYTQLS
ncbi:tubulin delta chain isoform X4 [Echeneis naucrates]|uniref:tubulin delta chain isoform X4 n=1 Tax=Echeneis naucrates TaxID=173247 RepID=UPI001113F7EE|nr:tubulin delta chain isoform X4 [Echeneis naucrates]